jgi:hypothetical protein
LWDTTADHAKDFKTVNHNFVHKPHICDFVLQPLVRDVEERPISCRVHFSVSDGSLILVSFLDYIVYVR